MISRLTKIVITGAFLAAALVPSFAEDLPRMVIVHKITGVPWTDAMARGVEAASEEYGIDATLTGPAAVDVAQQTKLLEDILAQGVDVLGFVPLDERVAEPILKRARSLGTKIVTLEGPGQPGKDWNVDLIDSIKFGQEQMKSLAEAMGGEGDYIIFVGTLTTPLHNVWADAALAYQKKALSEHEPGCRPVPRRRFHSRIPAHNA